MSMLVTKEGRELFFQRNDGELAKFDLKNKILYRKNNKVKDWYKVSNANYFFEGYEVKYLTFKDTTLEKFIKELYDIFMNWQNRRFNNISSLFTIVFERYEYLQSYSSENIRFQAHWNITRGYYSRQCIYKGVSQPLNFYDKHVREVFKKYNFEFTKDFEEEYEKNKEIYISLCQYVLKNVSDVKVFEEIFKDLPGVSWIKKNSVYELGECDLLLNFDNELVYYEVKSTHHSKAYKKGTEQIKRWREYNNGGIGVYYTPQYREVFY